MNQANPALNCVGFLCIQMILIIPEWTNGSLSASKPIWRIGLGGLALGRPCVSVSYRGGSKMDIPLLYSGVLSV